MSAIINAVNSRSTSSVVWQVDGWLSVVGVLDVGPAVVGVVDSLSGVVIIVVVFGMVRYS